jgi:hypothetical protein
MPEGSVICKRFGDEKMVEFFTRLTGSAERGRQIYYEQKARAQKAAVIGVGCSSHCIITIHRGILIAQTPT